MGALGASRRASHIERATCQPYKIQHATCIGDADGVDGNRFNSFINSSNYRIIYKRDGSCVGCKKKKSVVINK